MNKICTSIEQSKKLIELGIDRKSSDMFYWCGENIIRIGGHEEQSEFFDIPCWSLSALIKMLPKGFLLMDDQGESESGLYSVWVSGFSNPHIWRNNPVDAVFEMVCWLLENGKIQI